MKIFRHKENRKLYVIEIVRVSGFLDGVESKGVYAYPYKWKGDKIFFQSTDYDGLCLEYIKNNFLEISEI